MRYIVRPRQTIYDDLRETPMLEARTVHEPGPLDTGIVDVDGNRIYRVMSPIGFVELKERS